MTDWNTFLAAQGAVFDLYGVSRFGSTPLDYDVNHTFLVALNHLSLLTVEGPDAGKFLQGQVTCDVRELAGNFTRLGAQCDIKGRMVASFRALQLTDEKILLRMHRDLLITTQASLGKYIIFSKAKLLDSGKDYCHLGVVGPRAAELLKNIVGVLPTTLNEWCEQSGHLIIKLDENRYECWIGSTQAETLWQSLAPHCQLAGSNLWTLLDIRAGIGEVRAETREMFTPQALNFQLINAVNFRKGCYTGQEIVARLHYRGTLKRHMYRVQFNLDDLDQLPLPGAEVINAEGKNIGEIVVAALSEQNIAEALAVIPDAVIDQAYIAAGQPKKLAQLPLPYAIPSEDKAD